jgi:FK506-binding protein 4/5
LFSDGFCELFERTPEDLIYLASQLKSEGVQLYKEKRMNDAFSKFSKACKFLILIDSRDTESSVLEQRNQLLATLYSNLAGCHVVSKNWNDAIWLCDKVLLIQKSNVKALFRRGISYIELQVSKSTPFSMICRVLREITLNFII